MPSCPLISSCSSLELEGNNPGPSLSTTGGDTAYVPGDLFLGSDTLVSVSGDAAGVASDTMQAGEVLSMNFFTSDPHGHLDPPTATANTIFFTFDGVGAGEDLVVILKLVDASNPLNTITKAIVVDYADLYTDSNPPPAGFGIPALDSNDAAVIIESNDYNLPGENWVIQGAQVMVSTEGITGTGINLNPDIGPTGGSTDFQEFEGTLGTANPEADTTDGDVIKISSVGFITETTETQDADLTFTFTNIDADGDQTTTQVLNVHIEGGQIFEGTSAVEALQGDSADNTFTGGDGNDLFVLEGSALANGHDTITDFVSGADDILVDVASQNLTIGTSTTITAGQYETGTDPTLATSWDASGSANKFFFETDTNELWYSAIGDGSDRVALAQISTGAPAASDIHTF